MASKKIELSKEVQSLLNRVKSLNLQNEINQQEPKEPTADLLITNNDENLDEDEVPDNDIIDLDHFDLSNDECWLLSKETPSTDNIDLYKWLRQDLDQFRSSDFSSCNTVCEAKHSDSDLKFKPNIDSRTFTRPKKRVSRPSLENFVCPQFDSTITYPSKKRLSELPKDANISADYVHDTKRLSYMSVLKKSQDTNESSEPNLDALEDLNKSVLLVANESLSSRNLGDISKSDSGSLEILNHINDLTEKIRVAKSSSQNNSYELSDNENYNHFAVGNLNLSSKIKELNLSGGFNSLLDRKLASETSSAADNDIKVVQPNYFRSISPPSLLTNLTSLTESDFITAMNQPHDLYTSITSMCQSITEDESEERSGNFSGLVHDLNATFAKDIQDLSDNHSHYFLKSNKSSGPESLNATYTQATSDLLNDASIINNESDNGRLNETLEQAENSVQLKHDTVAPENINITIEQINHPDNDPTSENNCLDLKYDKFNETISHTPLRKNSLSSDLNKTFDKTDKSSSAVQSKRFSLQNTFTQSNNQIADRSLTFRKSNSNALNDTYKKNLSAKSNSAQNNSSGNNCIQRKSLTPSTMHYTGNRNITFDKFRDLNNTFVKVPSPQKISVSDPNLADDEGDGKIEAESTFRKTKEVTRNVCGSTDSLDGRGSSASDSSLSSAKVLNMGELDELCRLQEESLQQVMSTPVPNLLLKRAAWTSTEALSPIARISDHGTSDDSDVSFDEMVTARTSFSSAHSSPRRLIKDSKVVVPRQIQSRGFGSARDLRIKQPVSVKQSIQRPEVRFSKAQPVPTMVVKPLELKKSGITAVPSQMGRQSGLRPPTVRAVGSGLPRPTGPSSGIPRPASRIPAPRGLKPPASYSKSSVPKNNWMDGCF